MMDLLGVTVERHEQCLLWDRRCHFLAVQPRVAHMLMHNQHHVVSVSVGSAEDIEEFFIIARKNVLDSEKTVEMSLLILFKEYLITSRFAVPARSP